MSSVIRHDFRTSFGKSEVQTMHLKIKILDKVDEKME